MSKLKKLFRRIWIVLKYPNAVVLSDRYALTVWVGQFAPMVTASGDGPFTCSRCGKTSVQGEINVWEDMHLPYCSSLEIVKFQQMMMRDG